MEPAAPHILIIDDDPEIRQLLTAFLQKNGFRVTGGGDGRAMRRVLAEARIDLMLLDLMLPGEDGLSLCRDVRANSDIPIIMITARGEEMDRIIGLEIGADDYLPKPFSPRELSPMSARFCGEPVGSIGGQPTTPIGWASPAGRCMSMNDG